MLSRTLASFGLGLAVVVCTAISPGAQAPAASASQPRPRLTFAADIQPLLAEKCLSCHGEALKLSKLDLRTRDSALSGGNRGPALVPGNAEQSRMYRHVAGLELPAMPMRGTPLTAAQISALKRWIDEGATWTDAIAAAPATTGAPAIAAFEDRPITAEERSYWAFKLPTQAPLPTVARKDLVNPIDRFLEEGRVKRGLSPAPRADRLTLVRRAYLDLLGLPPTPAEVAQFVADDKPGAWERLIDRLLASPHYGERYGRHWLDVARYADSGGLRVRRASAQRVALPRLRDPVVQRRQAVQHLPDRADCRRRDGRQDARQLDRDRIPARRPTSAVPREGQPRAPLRLSGRCAEHNREGHARPHDRLRALPRSQVRSDPAARLLRDAGVDLRLRRNAGAARARARSGGIPRQERSDRRQEGRAEAADRRHREAASRSARAGDDQDAVSPTDIYQAAAKPENERTPGEKLLADSGVRGGQRSGRRARQGAVTERAGREAGAGRRAGSPRERTAQAAADGRGRHRRRLPLLTARRRRRNRQLPEVPNPAAVSGKLHSQRSRQATRCRRRTS